MDEVFAQAECEGWSNRSIARAMERCYEQENKEVESFLVAVEEAENRNARLHVIRRGQQTGDNDEEEGEGDLEDNNDDADESDSEAEGASNLVTTSCRQRNHIDLV